MIIQEQIEDLFCLANNGGVPSLIHEDLIWQWHLKVDAGEQFSEREKFRIQELHVYYSL